ncbi:calcium-independent phospholipase A2-gamma-like [Genypterus blacodes]|uniref:calcium-independent phospholipase A2-gamma-like n=1 Tax=Genypterus blacodes TaxID=154954 RepID=UPI003F75C68B
MGRYFSTNLWSSSSHRTMRSFCKTRFLVTNLRNFSCQSAAPHFRDIRCSVISVTHPHRFTQKAFSKNTKLNLNHTEPTSSHFLRILSKDVKNYEVIRFYSSSNRDAFKAEAPIGIFEETENSLSFSSLGGRLGQSFNQLSRHINVYFKKKDLPAVSLADDTCFVVPTQKYLVRSQKRRQSQQTLSEQNSKDNQETSGTNTGLHLFHISSLATRFGESYTYVANHINTVFSRGISNIPTEDDLETFSSPRGSTRRQRRSEMKKCIINSKAFEKTQVKMDSNEATDGRNNSSSSWEESYRYFARHINKYFGAKVTDNVGQDQQVKLSAENASIYQKQLSSQSTSKPKGAASHIKLEEPITESGGLFHTSHHTTHFGENYFQMASHINQYFKDQSGLEGEMEGNLTELDPGSASSEKSVSVMDCLRHPTSAIHNLLGAYLNLSPRVQTPVSKLAVTSLQGKFNRKLILSQRQAQEMSHGLIGGLGQASSPHDLTACIEALNAHLLRYPSCKALMWQEKTAVTLLRLRRMNRDNPALQSAIRETLASVGYVDPVKGRGIRVLSIDGGGTRGVVPLQVLKLLEAETGKKIHQLFDYICGVSTGAVLGFMLGLARFSLEECAEMYRRFGSEVFRQNPLVGTVKMGWSHSYYNTETWETILREKLGDKVLIKTARDELSPKVSAVSAVVNWGNTPKAFVFRNYNHTPGSLTRYAGGSACQMWQAVRASSAAPGYFQEFTLQSDIHQDGGIILNNPCALAVHESRLLWPNQPFQCVLSLGTGRYDNAKRGPATSTSLRAKISNMICSATDTEGVHTLLDDLLAPDIYFRFNPMLSAEVSLDESRQRALDQLQTDTQTYLQRNQLKLARLCLVLGAERSPVGRTRDWIGERAWEMKQRWV